MNCFQERFLGQMESPSSRKVVELVFLRKPDRRYKAIALNSVMSKWYASCILLRLDKGKRARKVEDLHMGGVDGISCQHLQVLTTNVLQKHWEWQEERNPVMKHVTVVRPMMFMAAWVKGAPRLWQKMETQILANVEAELMNKRRSILLDMEGERHIKFAASCGPTVSGLNHTQKKIWNRC